MRLTSRTSKDKLIKYVFPLHIPSFYHLFITSFPPSRCPRRTNNQALGAVLPEALNPESWTASGTELQKEGEAEVKAAKVEKEMGAVVDSAAGKLKS